jgi:hypothetical protein
MNRLTGLRWWRHASPRDDSPETVLKQNAAISRCLLSSAPCAIGKIGTTELLGLEFFERTIRLSWPQAASWHRPARRLYDCSGLFPVRKDIFYRWNDEYRAALKALDVVAQWQPGEIFESVLEKKLIDQNCPHAFRAGFNLLRFIHPTAPWVNDLAKLRWLVIHPFRQAILAQLPHLAELGVFLDQVRPNLIQRAKDTRIISCPQFSYMVPPRHRDWFESLEDLKAQMERETFDIALVGAGAWSLPLVAHAKKLGRKGIHLGGALQLVFGIKGGRFDPADIYNQAWIRPLPEEIPKDFKKMEQGAYW